MDNRPPIERVREREQSGTEQEDTAREVFGQKDAKLQREATDGAPTQESDEQFTERMHEKLRESDNEPDE